MTAEANASGVAGHGPEGGQPPEWLLEAKSRLPADLREDCAKAEDMELLREWDRIQSGLRRLGAGLLDDVEAEAGVTHSTFQVLWFLMGCERFTARMNQLSQILGFSTAGTTKVADRMAEAGLIERTPSTEDRRVILVTLTDAGLRASVTAIRAFLKSLRQRAVGPLGPEGFAALGRAVAVLDPGGSGTGCPRGGEE